MGAPLVPLVVVGLIFLTFCAPRRRSEVAERIASADARPVPAREVFGPLTADCLSRRPVPLPVSPASLDDAYVAEGTNVLFAEAIALCRRDAELRENAALMDEYAASYPMQQRPRVVARAEPEINPMVENS
jgi:hypothetical protein